MPRTLVTGANGFLAVHITQQLIQAGHQVTGTVRSPDKGEQVLKVHPEFKGHLDFVTVEDLTSKQGWDGAFKSKDFDYVVHTAAPLLDDPKNTDFDKNYLEPAVDGNTSLLESISQYAPNLKSVVVTGSINAITTGAADDLSSRTLTSKDWLPLGPADAREAKNAYISYCVAKKEAERAVWDYVKKHKPKYSVTVLLPSLIFGPPIHFANSIKKINFSTDQFYSLWNGENNTLPETGFAGYIDVRDLSHLHVLALTSPEVSNKRVIVSGHPYSHSVAANVLRKIPELKGRIGKDNPDDKPVHPKYEEDDEQVKRWLDKATYRSKEETFGDAAKRVLELEKELK